ncbi:hypothetical protein FAZ19_16310 [Sphingobacterium alkalisoli]|uniref:Uncharacterized protein n=1 Tax=Sphingobacterium alkalisoli TaxID=1874115 RepID=A0A4U0GXC9_9SPHI|nr:hypothetical protein [Sphingobacterium alkalisoli]TJY63830.1 hypothetical protein FAZ19_16310 [Sphingobacterium alkalisoli]GGH24605.1 hypothetical protein GCM10011418_32640 [Sphingobacterium alkalisoli]
MNKLLTRLFVGDYKFKALGLFHSMPRPAAIIMPLMIILGVYSINIDVWLYQDTLGVIGLIVLAIAIYFGFIYFWIWPAKWENQTNSQKWQHGNGIRMSVLTNVLTEEQWAEWHELNDYYLPRLMK